ncbi:MAG: hypothetical protein Q9M91_07540 [Candidatus Dojkabacteria bacterium]|nr:hypothetical protein [Candidatus Dojkabacteria bacterium]MDQ7021638.1 hypothetical protein [Candidatus Dojkabacteria bacterium]
MLKSIKQKIESTADFISSDKVIHFEEKMFGFLAGILLLINIVILFLAKRDIIENDLLNSQSYISTVALPFTVILISEIFVLIKSYNQPLVYSLMVQVQIVSLIFARDIFKVFSDLNGVGSQNFNRDIFEIAITLAITVTLFFVAEFMKKFIGNKRNKNSSILHEPKILKKARKYMSLRLFFSGVAFLSYYLLANVVFDPIDYLANGVKLNTFFENVFTVMILSDVLLFLLGFIYHEEYQHLFSNALLIISAILIRLAITNDFPSNVYLVGISALILMLVVIYNSSLKLGLNRE